MHKTKRLAAILSLVLLVGLLVAGCGGDAPQGEEGQQNSADYPTRNIELVVGWGAGGGTDNFARAIAQPLSEILGQPIVIVNKPGASGSIAGDYVTKQPADGYTIWAISSNYPLNVALGRTPHDVGAYIPIARVQNDTATIQVAADSPYQTIDELIEAAKAEPNTVTVGGTGAKGFDEIVLAMFEKEAGVDFNYVSFEDAGEMRSQLLGGHIDAMFEEFGSTISLIQEGSIKVLLAFTEERLADFPDVPVAPEKGWNVTEGQSRGLLVPAGTPDEVVQILQDAVEQAKDDPGYKQYEKDSYLHLRPGYLNSQDFTTQLQRSIETYKAVLADLGV